MGGSRRLGSRRRIALRLGTGGLLACLATISVAISAPVAGADTSTGSVPSVSAVSPNSGPVSGGTAITITGTNFVSGATVVIGQGHLAGAGAIPATSVVVVSSTEITAVTGGGAMAGSWGVFVINPDRGTNPRNGYGDSFTYS
jgi:hypothetical protein